MQEFARRIAEHYERTIILPGKQPQFFLLVAFLLTFIIVRAITHAIRAGRGPFHNIGVGGVHIHHFVPGIAIVLTTGYLDLAFAPRIAREPLAALFGLGAALVLDEFALWLNLRDVYWSREGRRSVDAVIIVATILALILLGKDFWIALGREIGHLVGIG